MASLYYHSIFIFGVGFAFYSSIFKGDYAGPAVQTPPQAFYFAQLHYYYFGFASEKNNGLTLNIPYYSSLVFIINSFNLYIQRSKLSGFLLHKLKLSPIESNLKQAATILSLLTLIAPPKTLFMFLQH